MEYIFAVVQDHAGELDAVGLLVQEDRLNDPVQTVGLACGTGMRHLDPDQLAKAPSHPFDFGDGRWVIYISADEDQVVPIVERRDHVLEHRRNHRLLEPRRYHDGERLLIAFIELLGGQWPVGPPYRETTVYL